MVICARCGRKLDGDGFDGQPVSISAEIMGDEYTHSYYRCSQCRSYTVRVYYDRFLGNEEESAGVSLTKEEGDVKVRMISECPEPWNKKCRCPAHRAFFGDSLD
jgi:hypothetical protein